MRAYFLIPALSFAFILNAAFGYGQKTTLSQPFMDTFKGQGLDKRYSLEGSLKPSYLQADLNGDGVEDIVVTVIERSSKKKGVLIIHGKTGEYFVFGAGNAGNATEAGDDFSWADKWALYKKKTAYETLFDKSSGDIKGSREVKLVRVAVLIEHYEDGASISGGIIYWSGKKYRWIHQGE